MKKFTFHVTFGDNCKSIYSENFKAKDWNEAHDITEKLFKESVSYLIESNIKGGKK